MAGALIAAATAGPARADATTPAAKADAEALFRVGQAAFDATHYSDAASAFEQAYAKLPLPAIAFSAAQAHRLQYFVDDQPPQLARAVALYHIYLDALPDGPRRSDAIANLAQIEPLLRALQAAGATLDAGPVARRTQLLVTADVAGARATIDGGTPVVTPTTRDVADDAGDHAIVVEAPGYERFEITQRAIPHEMVPVEAHLVAKAAHLRVRALAGAHLAVDGRVVGDEPVDAIDVAAGRHLVAVTARGHEPFARELELARGADLTLDAPLADTRQRVASRYVLIGSAVVAAAAITTGIFALRADSDASAALAALRAGNDADPDAVARYSSLRASRDDRVDATELLGGAAVAVALTGLALYLFDQPVLAGRF
jgi:hypothetical protein